MIKLPKSVFRDLSSTGALFVIFDIFLHIKEDFNLEKKNLTEESKDRVITAFQRVENELRMVQ